MHIVEYPKWLFPKEGKPVLVQTKEERDALVGEFKESPADWVETESVKEEGESSTVTQEEADVLVESVQAEIPPEAVVTESASASIDEMKAALKQAGFKDAQLKKKSEEEIRNLFAALKQGA